MSLQTFDLLAFLAALSLLPIHELGHYLMAKKFGWKPKFAVVMWKKWMPSMAVYTDINVELKTEQDFLILYAKLTAFSTMGIIAPWIAMIAYLWLGIFNLETTFVALMFFGIYGIIEVSQPSVEVKKDK